MLGAGIFRKLKKLERKNFAGYLNSTLGVQMKLQNLLMIAETSGIVSISKSVAERSLLCFQRNTMTEKIRKKITYS